VRRLPVEGGRTFVTRLGERSPAFAVIGPHAPSARRALNLDNGALDGANEWREKSVERLQKDLSVIEWLHGDDVWSAPWNL
jgi:hypothetical protein